MSKPAGTPWSDLIDVAADSTQYKTAVKTAHDLQAALVALGIHPAEQVAATTILFTAQYSDLLARGVVTANDVALQLLKLQKAIHKTAEDMEAKRT